MSCPGCTLDYAEMQEQIDGGNLSIVENLLEELASRSTSKAGAIIIFCPSCRETLARLRARVASRLRKQTLENIHNLLDEAYDRRKQGR